ATQMGVTIRVARVDARRLDRHGGRRAGRIGPIEVELAFELVEGAAHLGDHRVPGLEPDAAVRRVEGVGAGELLERRDGAGRGHVMVPPMPARWGRRTDFVDASTSTLLPDR